MIQIWNLYLLLPNATEKSVWFTARGDMMEKAENHIPFGLQKARNSQIKFLIFIDINSDINSNLYWEILQDYPQ